MAKVKSWYCKGCGFIGAMKEKRAGSGWITFVLICFLVLPGLIYDQWRWSKRSRVCPKCGGRQVIPSDSPIAKAEIEKVSA